MLVTVGKDKLISDNFQWIPTDRCISVGWWAKTDIDQLCADSGWHVEDLLRARVQIARENQGNLWS